MNNSKYLILLNQSNNLINLYQKYCENYIDQFIINNEMRKFINNVIEYCNDNKYLINKTPYRYPEIYFLFENMSQNEYFFSFIIKTSNDLSNLIRYFDNTFFEVDNTDETTSGEFEQYYYGNNSNLVQLEKDAEDYEIIDIDFDYEIINYKK
jgi:hypothetical protein